MLVSRKELIKAVEKLEECEAVKDYTLQLTKTYNECDRTLGAAQRTIESLNEKIYIKNKVIIYLDSVKRKQSEVIANDQFILSKTKKKATAKTIGWTVGGVGVGFVAGLVTALFGIR